MSLLESTKRLTQSWTLSFLRSHSSRMSVGSAIRYRKAYLRSPGDVTELLLRIRRPFAACVRVRVPSSDQATMYDVVFREVYGEVGSVVPDCRYIIDLGANIGLATAYFATLYPEAFVFAVEPHPDTFRLLQQNTDGLVRAGRCMLAQLAAWSEPRELALFTPEFNFDASHIAEKEVTGGDLGQTLVQGVPMSEIIERSGFPRVDLLKADIEGAEREIFSGDTTWLEQVGAIAIEFHGDAREAIGFDRIMAEHNFRIVSGGNLHTTIAVKQS